MLRRCPSCHTESLAEGASVCPLCGAKVAPGQQPSAEPEYDVEAIARRNRRGAEILLTILAIVGGIGSVPIFFTPEAPWWIQLPLGAAILLALATAIARKRGKTSGAMDRAHTTSMRFLSVVGGLAMGFLALTVGAVILIFVVCTNTFGRH